MDESAFQMKKILLITTVYRTGEKIYAILPQLAKKYSVDVLNLFQMSKHTPWGGDIDLRRSFYQTCKSLGVASLHGPKFHKSADRRSLVYEPYLNKIRLDFPAYDGVIIDNNTTIRGGHLGDLYNFFRKKKTPVIACPHGNKEFKKYKVLKKIGKTYDFSFVFGKKERKRLAQVHKKYQKQKSRLLCGGIPSNDALKNRSRQNKYILVIPNLTDPAQAVGQCKGFKVFSKKVFDTLKLSRLSDRYNCPVVIKEKNKLYHNTSILSRSLKGYNGVNVIMDCSDDNQLIADSCCVVSAPSTMAFKPIQMGIPTVLLKGHGMVGNLEGFSGLIRPEWKYLKRSLARQEGEGRDEEFIKSTLEGGLDFSSSEVYLRHIDHILVDHILGGES